MKQPTKSGSHKAEMDFEKGWTSRENRKKGGTGRGQGGSRLPVAPLCAKLVNSRDLSYPQKSRETKKRVRPGDYLGVTAESTRGMGRPRPHHQKRKAHEKSHMLGGRKGFHPKGFFISGKGNFKSFG